MFSILSILTRIASKSFSKSNYHDGRKLEESDSQSTSFYNRLAKGFFKNFLPNDHDTIY